MTRVCLVVAALVATLLVPGRAGAVPTGTPVTPEGWSTDSSFGQATDRQGDTAYFFWSGSSGASVFGFRIRRADGSLTPVAEVTRDVSGFSSLLVAVDGDGDGAVVWDQPRPDFQSRTTLFARRFTKSGALGPVVQLTPSDHAVASPAVVARKDGAVVVTWSHDTLDPTAGFVPYARTLGADSTLGPVLRLGDGPNPGNVLAAEPDGDTVYVWNELRALKTRRLTLDGRLTKARTLYRWEDVSEVGNLYGLGVDRRGVATLVFGRWRPVLTPTPLPPGGDTHERGSFLRISPSGRPIGQARYLFPIEVTFDHLRVGVAPDGTTVLGWQANFYEGARVRRLSADGRLGPASEVADGGLFDILLRRDGDGVVTTTSRAADGLARVVRVARVVDGHVRRAERAAMSGREPVVVRGALLPRGRWSASWVDGIDPAQLLVTAGR